MKCASSYRTNADQRRRTQKTYTFSSQQFREKLVKNCVPIVREARKMVFTRQRSGLNPEKFDFDEVLRHQIAELQPDEQLRRDIYDELFDEMNQWLAEQTVKEDRLLFGALLLEEGTPAVRVTCPICKLCRLSCTPSQDGVYNVFSCVCGTYFKFPADIEMLKDTIQSRIDSHEEHCGQALQYFLVPMDVSDELAALGIGGNLLSVSCSECQYYATI